MFTLNTVTATHHSKNDHSFYIKVTARPSDTGSDTLASRFVPSSIEHLAIFPNPTADQVWLNLRTIDAGLLEVNLLDMAGRRVRNLHTALHPAGTQLLNLSPQVAPGVYLLQVRSGQSTRTEKLVVE